MNLHIVAFVISVENEGNATWSLALRMFWDGSELLSSTEGITEALPFTASKGAITKAIEETATAVALQNGVTATHVTIIGGL